MCSASSCTHVRARREIESVRLFCARAVCLWDGVRQWSVHDIWLLLISIAQLLEVNEFNGL